MTDAIRDGNHVPVALGVLSTNSTVTTPFTIDGSGKLLINAGGSGSSSGFQIPTGTVNGSNAIFTFALPPNAVSVDHMTYQKTSSDGTANWTGTTIITLAVAPTSDIFGVN